MAGLSGEGGSGGRRDGCGQCAVHPERTRCEYCTRKRREIGRMADAGVALAEIARRKGITERWASALLADEQSVREREALRCNEVPVEIVLAAVERWQERAPEYNTWSELARRMRYRSEHTLRRALGAVAKNGRKRKTVDVELAARAVREMGFTPCEFDWL
jgi:hypothetical protein